MSRFATKIVKDITPYAPGEQPQKKFIKLNTNENPFSISTQLKIAITDQLETLNLYPDPDSSKLKNSIANYYDLSPENIFVGNGSDEVLAHIFQAFFANSEQELLMPDITYSFYQVYANLYNSKIKKIALDENFNLNIADYQGNGMGIIFPNPNAPTGILLNMADIKTLLDNNADKLIVIDEAYIDFAECEPKSAVAFIKDYDNLIVVQTFSKSRSLAGLRLGFAMANSALIEDLNKVKNSFNSYPVDRIAQAAGSFAMEDKTNFETRIKTIIETRKYLIENLADLGFSTLPSQANFVFTRHAKFSAKTIQAKLREKNILVRHFSEPSRIENYLRISIGSKKDMQQLVNNLKSILKK